MPRHACAHCGLPVVAPPGADADRLFCCYGCRLAAGIVGRQGEDGVQAWGVLRLGVGTLLAMNVMMISILLYTGRLEPGAAPAFRWAMLGLATPAMLILGYPFVTGAAAEIARGRLSLDTLIAIGSVAAYAVSAANTVRGAGDVYFDTATMLPALVTFGKLIEATAKSRAGRLIRGLETLLPARALRETPDGPRETPVGDLRPGDRVRVRPGERFPVDGRILDGVTTVEEAAFTGEPEPRRCGRGDAVIAGTVNGQGPVLVAAERVGEDLLLARLVEMAEQARSEVSPTERLAERAAAAFVPAVLVLAIGAGLAWLAAGDARQAGMAVLATLVVACPCAMGIAAPLATAVAIGRAAREGVLVRGGDVMERIGQVRTVFLDKTGTVTAGRPEVLAVETCNGVAPDALLAALATLESASEHALARAVMDEARRRNLPVGTARRVEVVLGLGVRGEVTIGAGPARHIVAGSEAFVSGDASTVQTLDHTSEHTPAWAAADGATVIHVAWDGRLRGRVRLGDAVRSDAAEAVRRLHAAGLETVLLSGDRAEAARAVAAEIGIPRVEAPRRPDEKIAAIRTARAAGGAAMVGDGINDAPALAAADVGIAIGAGTDLARQAGHVVLLSDRLGRIPWLVGLSRRTRRIVRQNLAWALGYNAVALAAAAAGWLHPLLAAGAMVVSSLTVLANSLRLRQFAADGGQDRRGQDPLPFGS